jgi:hypothetical protein
MLEQYALISAVPPRINESIAPVQLDPLASSGAWRLRDANEIDIVNVPHDITKASKHGFVIRQSMYDRVRLGSADSA